MLDPAWVAGPLAAAVLATTVYGAARLVAAPLQGRRIEYDVDITSVVMGSCMAGMLISQLNFLDAAAWETVLALAAAWHAARIIAAAATPRRANRRRRPTHDAGHLLSASAMLYAFHAPSAAPHSMPMTASAGADPHAHALTLAPLLAVLLFCYAMLLANRMRQRAGAACELVMSLAMGLMLVLGL